MTDKKEWDIETYKNLETFDEAREYFEKLDLKVLGDFIYTLERVRQYIGITEKDKYCLSIARPIYQIRRNNFLHRIYDIERKLGGIEVDIGKSKEEIEQEIKNKLQQIIKEIKELKKEERVAALNDWIKELESVDVSIEEEKELEKMDEIELQVRIDEIKNEISECRYRGG